MGKYAVTGRTPDGTRMVQYYDEHGNLTQTKIGGDRSWRNNNPGNLKGSSLEIGKDHLPTDDGAFSIFPDKETGDMARSNLLQNKYGDYTINDMIPKYASPDDGNDVPGYRRDVANFSGLDMNKKINDLTPDEFNRLTSAMSRREGAIDKAGNWKSPGTIIPGPATNSATPSQPNTAPQPAAPAPKQTSDAGPDADSSQQTASTADAPPSDDLPHYAADITGDTSPTLFAPMAVALNEAQDSASDATTGQPQPTATQTEDPESQSADATTSSPAPANTNLSTYAADITGDTSPTLFAPMAVALNEVQEPSLDQQTQDDTSTGLEDVA